MKQIIRITFIFTFILISISGCKKDHYGIKSKENGYLVTDIPDEIMMNFKEKEEIKITLDDSELGETSIIGLGIKDGQNSFFVETSEKLAFSPVLKRTWLLMWFGNSSGVRENCSGCSRDSSLKTYKNDNNMCYCTYSKVASQ
jgi:hypothetical protein